jgi:hypothetical protein
MNFSYKNTTYKFPTSLSEISLKERIQFDKLYGKLISDKQKELFLKDDSGNDLPADELELMLYNIEIANKNFSFFTNIPLSEVETNIPIESVLTVYHACFKGLYEQMDKITLEDSYLWNDEFWFIDKPALTYQSQITFNELIVSKQIVKQMHDLGAGHWEAMPYLAAIFLKRENEVFDESWLAPDSERVLMMQDLPMDIAMAIGFFLQISMSLFTKTLAFSQEVETAKGLI